MIGGTVLYRTKVAQLALAPTKSAGQKSGALSPPTRGKPNAPVTLEEFGDFQCPPCADLAPVLTKIEHDYGAKLRVIFREHPLTMHAHADLAARVAEAAGKQNRFWEMHDLLYRFQLLWSKAPEVEAIFNKYALSLGLEIERFKSDVASEEVKARILADQQRANSLGITSTPSLLLNNTLLPPASVNEPGLRAAIEAVLGGKPPVPRVSSTPMPVPAMSPIIPVVAPSPAPAP